MKRVTIKDLAQMLNLSTSTISRALSGHPDISEATRKRVQETADAFNYTTNLNARLFRKQSSGLIALILPEINMFYSPQLIEGINEVIASTNYSLITFISNDNIKREKEIVKHCLSWAVEGVMISLSTETQSIEHLQPLYDTEIKCLLLDRIIENECFPSIKNDGELASYKATSHLIEKGHTNILGFFYNINLGITQDRIRGYKKAFKDKGVELVNENILSINYSRELDFILPSILKHNAEITAIFTMSDELLAKTFFQLSALGITVPDDLSLISISDGVFPELSYPKISYLKDSGLKMGKEATYFLLDLIKQKEKKVWSNLLLSSQFIELDSIKDLRAKK